MTATRRLRGYFQCHNAPLEVLQALIMDKVESKTKKQSTIKSFFVKPHISPIVTVKKRPAEDDVYILTSKIFQ